MAKRHIAILRPVKADDKAKKGNIEGLAAHLAKTYGGDPGFMTACMEGTWPELAGYNKDQLGGLCAAAHKAITGIYPSEHPRKTTAEKKEVDVGAMLQKVVAVAIKGGPGSGNYGHSGRPGLVGGSGGEGGGRIGGGEPGVGRQISRDIVTWRDVANKLPTGAERAMYEQMAGEEEAEQEEAEQDRNIKMDFSGEDLSGHDLHGESFHGKNVQGVNFSGSDLERADFDNADMRNADFSMANLHSARVSGRTAGANFRGANLRGARLMGSFRNADFRGADLQDIDGSLADFNGAITDDTTLTSGPLRIRTEW